MLNGKDLIMSIIIDGTAIASVKQRSFKLTVDCETIEISSANSSQWKEFITGRKKWSVSCGWLVVSNSNFKTNALHTGKKCTLHFGNPDGTSEEYMTGTAIITKCDVDASIGTIAKGSFTFKGTGALS